MKGRSPIIVIGMHRSGTSLVTRLLETMGLFVGSKKEGNHEAVFFQKLNEWILQQSGGAWDHPQPVKHLLSNQEIRALVVDYLRLMLNSPRVISYLGLKNYLRYRTPFRLDIPWGWKDPRNTFTLPLWLDLFPDAKIIHVYRHGVDVANSLMMRQDKILQNHLRKYKRIRVIIWMLAKRWRFTDTVRCSSSEGGIALWEEYMKEAQSHVKDLGSHALEIKFEELLEEPRRVVRALIDFCQLSPQPKQIQKAMSMIDQRRAYAYKSSPHLVHLAQVFKPKLQQFGY